MLIELICVMIVAVPLILGSVMFSKRIDERIKIDSEMRDAAHPVFFKGACGNGVQCSSSSIDMEDAYSIKIRKPSRPFDDKPLEDKKDEALNELYGRLEEAAKNSTRK